MNEELEVKNEDGAKCGKSVQERVVMWFSMVGKYSLIRVGEWYAVKRHGVFSDRLVNLDIPHLTVSMKGGPYFNQALGTKLSAERIYKRLSGVNAYYT